MRIVITLFILLLPFIGFIYGQQLADTLYNPPINSPAYEYGKGAVVFIDEGHHNFHTKEGRYKAFSNLLERDGYLVKPCKGIFDKKKLAEADILVISNALNQINTEQWALPTPSAFSTEEINLLEHWVNNGGRLFLIADHMPMAGAAEDLARSFGYKFTNGFVFDTINSGPIIFNRKLKTLVENEITRGRDSSEQVMQIATFTGQGFQIPPDATPILRLSEHHLNLLPDTAWVFSPKTKRINMKDWYQGAYKNHGAGKVVIFGEAAMFSAQLAGPKQISMGMNNPVAPENYQLLLNIIHWLDPNLD